MFPPKHERPGMKLLMRVKRRAISIPEEGPVKAELLEPGKSLPLLIEPTIDGVDLVGWMALNREFIETNLLKHGALLFRGFQMSVGKFEQCITTCGGTPLEYEDPTSPRSKVSGNIYTSTDYPPEHNIFMHNEKSYSHTWPAKLFFYCVTPSHTGGETPVGDVRKVLERIDPEIRERFREKKVMYVRNFGDELGLSWQSVFNTADKQTVEEICRATGVEVEWKEGNRLRTRQVRVAVARHPRTGETVWFNHAAFFHISTMEQSIQEVLLSEFGEADLPYNTFYGDGSPIEPATLDQIRLAYKTESVYFTWQERDVLMLDNMLAAHGRAAFSGPRKILVGMTEPLTDSDLVEP